MLLIYKPSNFITFNDLQDTCSITGQPFYLNYVGFQQTYSFPGHLAPQFWLVSTQLILSIVIRHLYFRWPPDNLLLSQPSSTQHHNNIKIYTIHWLLRKVWVSWKRHFPADFTQIFLVTGSHRFELKLTSTKKSGNRWFFKVSSLSPKLALEVAACQWHAFSNDRSGAEIEPVRVRPGLEQKIRHSLTLCLIFY